MSFHLIEMETWPRRTHYNAYTTSLPLNWNITVELDITFLFSVMRAHELRLYPVMLYLACTAIREIPAFRMGYDGEGRLGVYDEVHPSYTVFHKDDETFSDIWSNYHADFTVFYRGVIQDIETWGNCKGYKGRPDAPVNCCPMSMTPWLQFTNCSFDTFRPTQMLFPILTFGRHFLRDGRRYLPLAICASHAVADGWHAAQLVERMQHAANHPDFIL